MNKNFLQKMLAVLLVFSLVKTQAQTVNVIDEITANTNWTNDKTYVLFGDIIVKNGAVLTIQEGTLIKGNQATTSRLLIAKGAKIVAQGTPEKPIVFTSSSPAGQRARGDWAGIAVCGNAPINVQDGQGNPAFGRIECGTTADYDFGGNNADDSSGVISYVRIEYAGFSCAPNVELNSLTLGGVGRKTKIDHVQVSYGQDDGYEFFGGTVNVDHVISFGSRDDDFDTDFGWSGKAQFGLIIRVDTIADQGDISNAFESDNDANGSSNLPLTQGVISNFTIRGPAETVSSYVDAKYGWIARLRRNTAQSIFNSIFLGYKRGLNFDGSAAQANVNSGALEFKNNIIAGIVDTLPNGLQAFAEDSFDLAYVNNAANGNTLLPTNAAVNITSAYGNPANFNFLPQTGSPALGGSSFASTKLADFQNTNYRGAFNDTDNWTACWSEFTPQDEVYTSSPVNYAFTVSVMQSGSTVSATNVAGATYSWSNGNTGDSFTATASGTYNVTVTNARGCTATASANVAITGINELTNISGIRLFPNPNTGVATLEIAASNAADATISVLDVTGRELATINKELVNGTNQITINTSNFANGLYYVNVKNGAENKVVRMAVNGK